MKYSQPHLGRKIRALIKERGLTQPQTAKRLGISVNTLRKSLRQQEFRYYRLREFSMILGQDLFTQLLSEENRNLLKRTQELSANEKQAREASSRIPELEARITQLEKELTQAKISADKANAQVELLRDIMKGKK